MSIENVNHFAGFSTLKLLDKSLTLDLPTCISLMLKASKVNAISRAAHSENTVKKAETSEKGKSKVCAFERRP